MKPQVKRWLLRLGALLAAALLVSVALEGGGSDGAESTQDFPFIGEVFEYLAGSPDSGAPAPGSGSGFPVVGEPLFEDRPGDRDPVSTWGSIDCVNESRHERLDGGAPQPARAGKRQRGEGFRRLRLIDGDDFYGERCELGKNSHVDGPTALFHEGERRIALLSVRLPASFPVDASSWQLVMQIKQSQPSAGGGGSPMIAIHVLDGRWRLHHAGTVNGPVSDGELWSAPARVGVWTRFFLDVVYSQRPELGSITLRVDLDGDGDALDPNEQLPPVQLQTLKPEVEGGEEDGISPGESIPAHLRVGLYHDPAIGCPPPNGCYVDIGSVGVYEP